MTWNPVTPAGFRVHCNESSGFEKLRGFLPSCGTSNFPRRSATGFSDFFLRHLASCYKTTSRRQRDVPLLQSVL